MYYFDTSAAVDFDGAIFTSIVNSTPDETYLLNTMGENRSWFTPRQFDRAKLARRIYAMMSCDFCRYFQNMVRIHTMKNCLFIIEYITVANTIFGPDAGSLKGKTVRITPSRVVQNYSAVPESIRHLHRQVNIAVDIIYVNSLSFLVTLSWRLKYTKSMFIKRRKRSQ